MKKRPRRWWLVGAMVILVALGAAWLVMSERAPSISVSLVGQARVSMMAGPYPGDNPWRPVLIPCALVQVMNTDRVPVLITISIPDGALAEIARQHDVTARGAALNYFGFAPPLSAGGSTILHVPMDADDQPWQPRFNYVKIKKEWKLKARILPWLPGPFRMWLRQFKSAVEERSVQLGSVTNLSPALSP